MPDIFLAKSETKSSATSIAPKSFSDELNTQAESEGGMHLFTAFHEKPKHIRVINQEKDEEILLFLRRSLFTNIKWVVGSIVLLLIPLVLSLFINPFSSPFGFPFRYILFFVIFYYLLVFTYIHICFITWYFNISLVTNIRVIDIDFSNLIYKNLAATKLNLVQDVSYQQVGALRTLLDYGDVYVQTAGTLENFEFLAIPKPGKAVHIIEDLIGGDNI